jgi:anti-sigma-K factor RskA
MTMDRHADIAEKLESYALGQLPAQESREVDEHLRECSTCAQEARELAAVLTGIGESAPPVAPSLALRQRVLASVAVEPQEPARFERQVGIVQQPRQRVWSLVPLAAAAVLVLAVGAVALRVEQSRRQLKVDVARVQALNDELTVRLQKYSGQTDLALSILTSGDMREIPLTGKEATAIAAARAYWSPTRGLLLVADRMPAAPPGRVYQVWVIEKGGQPASAGLLGEESTGRGMLIVTPPKPGLSSSVTVAVTDEPPGGLPAPSGTTFHLLGSI